MAGDREALAAGVDHLVEGALAHGAIAHASLAEAAAAGAAAQDLDCEAVLDDAHVRDDGLRERVGLGEVGVAALEDDLGRGRARKRAGVAPAR